MKKLFLLFTLILTLHTVSGQNWHTVFYDDFSRSDGPIGSNYSISPFGSISISIVSNELKIISNASGEYCYVYLLTGYLQDTIRMSCKIHGGAQYRFSLGARHNNQYSLRAIINAKSDSIGIYKYDHINNTTSTLAEKKANLDISKTYQLMFTLMNQNLSFKITQTGTASSTEVNATDNTVAGTLIDWGSYHYATNAECYMDEYKVEKADAVNTINENENQVFTIYPNPISNYINLKLNRNIKTQIACLIYDATGKLIKSELLLPENPQIQCDYLNNGIYMLILKTEKQIYTQKIMIQH